MLRLQRKRFRYNKADFLSWLMILTVSAAAFGGAFLLGGIYLDIIREGVVNSRIVEAEDTETVSAGEIQKALTLNPLPIYYLQAGVYSSPEGAQTAAKLLAEAGFLPYITEMKPHRIWIGPYRQRSDAEPVKGRLLDLGISTFTGSTVLNSASLKYGTGNEIFMQSLAPMLEVCSDWLKENLEIFNAPGIDGLDWNIVQGQAALGQEIHKSLLAMQPNIKSGDEGVNQKLVSVFAAAEAYQAQLEIFLQTKTQNDYAVLQNKYLSFVDNYLLLGLEIDSMRKT